MRTLQILTLAFLCLCAPFLTARTADAGPTLLFDTRTGEVLHSYKPFDRWYPASLTKLMTVYVTFDAIEHGLASLNSPVTISERAAAQPPSKMGYKVGTQITVDAAIRILMVKSANDVSVALAESVGGTYERFIAGMNTAAARLGMTDSNFVNPHGLPDKRQITSARDLALLTQALIQRFPKYAGYFSMPSIQIGDRVMKNHNKLIGRFRGADGMKTGFICSSGFNVVSTATRGGRRLAVVVLGATNARHREEVAATLLEAGFAQGGGFRLFGPKRFTLADLDRPTRIVPPFDMHAYACGKRQPPPDVASFGYVERSAVEPAADSAALAMAPAIELQEPIRRLAPVATMMAPLPRTRPRIDVSVAARAPEAETPGDAEPVAEAAAEPGFPFPRPNPLRAAD